MLQLLEWNVLTIDIVPDIFLVHLECMEKENTQYPTQYSKCICLKTNPNYRERGRESTA